MSLFLTYYFLWGKSQAEASKVLSSKDVASNTSVHKICLKTMQQIIVKLNLQFVSGYGSFNNLYFNFSENNNKENSDDDLGVHPILLQNYQIILIILLKVRTRILLTALVLKKKNGKKRKPNRQLLFLLWCPKCL